MLVYMTGFEVQNGTTYLTSEGWTVNTSSALTTTGGRYGGTAIWSYSDFGSGLCDLSHSFDRATSGTTITVGFAFYSGWSNTDNLVSNQTQFFQIRNNTTTVGYIRLISSGGRKIQMVNAAGSVGVQSTTDMPNGAWVYIEATWVMSTSVGSMTLRVNGVQEGTATGLNNGSTMPNAIRLLTVNTGAFQVSSVLFDDIYVLDGSGSTNNTFLGEQKIILLNPTGAGNSTQWTPSAGSNWQAVDEDLANGDTDYIASTTPNNIDTYTLEDSPLSFNAYGVKTIMQARKNDSGTRQIAPVIRTGGTDYAGTSVALGASYIHYTQLYDLDPTSTPWATATVDGMELGVKHVT